MTAFSCEHGCKGTEQQIQELTIRKDRLEKLIANILNGEDYSKLQQILKSFLSDDKIILSIAFAALIQTLKANSRMVKLIPNMPSANNGQNKIIMITITLSNTLNPIRITY